MNTTGQEDIMNRSKEDTKYVFSPPLYSPVLAPIFHWLSDVYYLRRKHKVIGVRAISGSEKLRQLYTNGDSILITPNHSDHSDPNTLINLSRRYKMPMHFVAAREIFEKKKGLHGALLQRAGAFSIDREGSDIRAIKEIMRILYEARFPLVMFPEGEIYHTNAKLTPLNEGAASMALKIAAKFQKESRNKKVFIVPTAMKYSYLDDISVTFADRLTRLENSISWAAQSDLNVVDRIYKFGEAVLALKEKEFLNKTIEGPIDKRLHEFRETLITNEEKRYFSDTDNGNHPTRIRRLRGKIRTILLDENKPSAEIIENCYKSLDNIYMAVMLYSYPGQYLKNNPSMDRIAETIHKFEEDAFGDSSIQGRRTVEVTFCDPIDLTDHAKSRSKSVAGKVTSIIETCIKNILE